MIRKFLLSLSLLAAGIVGASAQSGEWASPLDIDIVLSANFAETRSNHFHSGIDIKTQGVEGKRIYSVKEGFISRIGVAPTGFGRVLYINHPDGTTSVYAHILEFRADIEEYVDQQRHRQKKHRVDLYPPVSKFPVAKGELVAWSGNSGSSAGPHLHFEIRNSATQRPYSALKAGIVTVRDDQAPVLHNLLFIPLDTLDGVPLSGPPVKYPLTQTSPNKYSLSAGRQVATGRGGYFVLETIDRKNDSPSNTFGVYSVDAELDGRRFFSFKLDAFSFSDTRYVNSLCYYPLQRGARNQFIRLAVQQENKLSVYAGVRNRGYVKFTDDAPHDVFITVTDDSGNSSTLAFTAIRGQHDERPYLVDGPAYFPGKRFRHNIEGLRVRIPADALYEPCFVDCGMLSAETGGVSSGVMLYSPVYTVGDPSVPLHKSFTLAIKPTNHDGIPTDKLYVATVSADGKSLGYAGGKPVEGMIEADSRTFGRFCLRADTEPPLIKININEQGDLRGAKTVSFTVTDSLTGVSGVTATIDGLWIPLEETLSKNLYTHTFNPDRITYSGQRHQLVVTATDNRGNTTTASRTFIR